MCKGPGVRASTCSGTAGRSAWLKQIKQNRLWSETRSGEPGASVQVGKPQAGSRQRSHLVCLVLQRVHEGAPFSVTTTVCWPQAEVLPDQRGTRARPDLPALCRLYFGASWFPLSLPRAWVPCNWKTPLTTPHFSHEEGREVGKKHRKKNQNFPVLLCSEPSYSHPEGST